MIISVQFKSKYSGKYSGREYSYFCDIPVVPGDIVQAPTSSGIGTARVKEINILESRVDARILPVMKTIHEKAEDVTDGE